jgi:hypothetical protein
MRHAVPLSVFITLSSVDHAGWQSELLPPSRAGRHKIITEVANKQVTKNYYQINPLKFEKDFSIRGRIYSCVNIFMCLNKCIARTYLSITKANKR